MKTSTKHKDQRVGVFIDTQNLYHSAKNLYKAKVNFGAILKEGSANRKLVRALAYVVTTETGEEAAFLDALENLGIEIRSKELKVFYGGAKKADWDVGLTVDAIAASQKLDTVVLVTGDGDFVPLVKYLQLSSGCQVEAAAFGRSASSELKEAVDDFLDLDEESSKFLIKDSNWKVPILGSKRKAANDK